ncbi:Hint domain-containing protein, partial [Acidisphaera rubrifaciens]|uniref:Hint domain-containing protein n=1 Tax=Acidisphaera rubrifaciens TaxID=50715 RepID=UPI00066295AA
MSGTTYDSDGTHDVAAGIGLTAVTVTHDSGTPFGQVPIVTLDVTTLTGTLDITSTNGAEAIVNTAQLSTAGGQLTYDANGGEIVLGPMGAITKTQDGTIAGGGTFDIGAIKFDGQSSPTLNVSYVGQGGTLVVDRADVTSFIGGTTISGFGGAGDVIDDQAINYGQIKTYSAFYSKLSGLETFRFYDGPATSRDQIGRIQVKGSIAATGTFSLGSGPLGLSADSSGGLLMVCFLAGTAIATPDGERLVESIAPGDLVRTASGAARAVAWVGHRTVERASLREADLHDPVVIAADAVAPGIPARDLRVTPDHAILIKDRLIPARLLVNGTTIRHEPIATYTYYHVELDSHDILLAEGLTVESYLDCADRGRFANAGVVALHAAPAAEIDAAAVYAAHGYRPLTLDAATVQPIWEALADRAAELGAAPAAPATTDDAGLHLLVDGRRIAPV